MERQDLYAIRYIMGATSIDTSAQYEEKVHPNGAMTITIGISDPELVKSWQRFRTAIADHFLDDLEN